MKWKFHTGHKKNKYILKSEECNCTVVYWTDNLDSPREGYPCPRHKFADLDEGLKIIMELES